MGTGLSGKPVGRNICDLFDCGRGSDNMVSQKEKTMRYRWLLILIIFPAWGAGQDSIKTEAKKVTSHQVDSIKKNTRVHWYKNPNVVSKGLERKLLDLNESILLYRSELKSRNKLDDSLNNLRDSINEFRYNSLVSLTKERKEKEQLLKENRDLYFQPLMFGLSLSTFLLVLYITFMIRGMFRAAIKKRKSEHVEKPNN